MDTAGKSPVEHHPIDWFVDDGLDPGHGATVALPGKAELEFTIEAPRSGLDAMTLFIGSRRVGTVGSIRRLANPEPEPAGTR